MSDYYVNIFLNDENLKRIEDAGLADQIKEIDGKKAVQIEMNKKEQKKVCKGFQELTFDESNACVLPEDAEAILIDLIVNNNTLDVMKFAISKIYNPLAGKSLRSKTF
jgi:hypothetical protein